MNYGLLVRQKTDCEDERINQRSVTQINPERIIIEIQ